MREAPAWGMVKGNVSTDTPPPAPQRPGPRRLTLAAIAGGLFVGDLVTPLGVAAGMPYVIVVLLAAGPGLRRLIVEAAVACTVLTCVGVFVSPEGGEPWVVGLNRIMAIAVIWATAILSIQLVETTRQLSLAEREAVEDPLTGLRNRRGFEQQVAAALGRAPAALLLFDLDRFKRINDELGHPVGDQALIAVADALRDALRLGDRWNCGRLGGDEFALLLPATDRDRAQQIGDRLKASVDEVLGRIHPACGVSFGLAVVERGTSPEALYAAADQELYKAKAERS